MPSADCLAIINKLRSENLKDLLGTLTEAGDEEATESLKKIEIKDPAESTAAKIAVKLAGTDVQKCESGKGANATVVGLLSSKYRSASTVR